MSSARRGRPGPDPLFADPRTLAPDDLVALVDQLQRELDRRQATIDQQAAALADLQRRGAAAQPAPPPAPKRDAKRVPGFDYTIVFDGGSLGNPGKGYGSFQIVGADGEVARESLDFGDAVTNNQAEYRTLITALERLQHLLGASAAEASVAVRGDSQLVIKTVTGEWKARHPELIPLRDRAQALLRGFGKRDVAWHRRSQSVRVLGH